MSPLRHTPTFGNGDDSNGDDNFIISFVSHVISRSISDVVLESDSALESDSSPYFKDSDSSSSPF